MSSADCFVVILWIDTIQPESMANMLRETKPIPVVLWLQGLAAKYISYRQHRDMLQGSSRIVDDGLMLHVVVLFFTASKYNRQ